MLKSSKQPAVPAHGSPGEATVFISYSRRDSAFVDRLDGDLQARGVRTLIDRVAIEAGEKWFERLKDLISRSEAVIFVLSPDSVRSKVCADEVNFGKSLGKRFIPVVARRVDDLGVPEVLSELNYVFLDDDATYPMQIDRLVAAIRTDLIWMRMHSDLGRAADEWVRTGQPRGLLLGTTRLREAEQWVAHRPADAPVPTADTRDLIAASRRAVRQWRNGLVGALAFGLVLSLGLAGLAYVQRQEAITQRREAVAQREVAEKQTELARQREHEAREQRDAAQRNFRLAYNTLESVVIDVAIGLRQIGSLPLTALAAVLSRVEAATAGLIQAAPGDPRIQRLRAVMLVEFGATYLAAGDRVTAEKAYREAIEIMREVARLLPDSETQNELAWTISKIGDVKLRVGDVQGALSAYQEQYEILRRWAEQEPRSGRAKQNLSVALLRIGDAKFQGRDASGALAAFEEALGILRDLAQLEPGNRSGKGGIIAVLSRIHRVRLDVLDRDGALGAAREGLTLTRTLLREEPNDNELQRALANYLTIIGDSRLSEGDASGAAAAFTEGLDIRRSLSRQDPTNAERRADLAISLIRVGHHRLKSGDAAGALVIFVENFEIIRPLAAQDPKSVRWQQQLIESLTSIGLTRTQLGQTQEALEAYEEALRTARALHTSYPEYERAPFDIVLSLHRIGDLREKGGDMEGARSTYAEALGLARTFNKRDDTAETQTALVIALQDVGLSSADARQRKECLTEALSILERLRQSGRLKPDQQSWPMMIRRQLERG